LQELLNHDLKECDTCHSDDVFAKKDNENLNGMIRIADFKRILRKTIFLTPKERNLILREITTPEVNYFKFFDIVYEARYQIAIAKIMDTSIDEVEHLISHEFETFDDDGDGYFAISEAGLCLRACKKLCLTPF
jgi:Ca2+-binding EF-hand superfamily protein